MRTYEEFSLCDLLAQEIPPCKSASGRQGRVHNYFVHIQFLTRPAWVQLLPCDNTGVSVRLRTQNLIPLA